MRKQDNCVVERRTTSGPGALYLANDLSLRLPYLLSLFTKKPNIVNLLV